MISNIDQYQEVPSVILENLMTADGNKISQYIPYRQKCILLFQEIDGVDVCLFCLYTQEFNADCPQPNTSKVYIAYLDSVEFFRPMEARTLVYHEIMVAYLQWAQFRGFQQCHIWSCPPQRGDNFIFWCHPSHQRTPSRERLGSWYGAMLNRATSLGILDNTSNLFNSYFATYSKRDRDTSLQRTASKNSMYSSNEKTQEVVEKTPVCPPIFEGDYWVNECLKVQQILLKEYSRRFLILDFLQFLFTARSIASFSEEQKAEMEMIRWQIIERHGN